MRLLDSGVVVVILLLACVVSLEAQTLRNTITFDNQSGEPALVKLVGPSAQAVEVPHGEKRMVTVAAGEYYLLARYGADPRHYTYSRGNPFKVEETTAQSSVITITLHKVVGGNYPSRSASHEEFDQAQTLAPKTPSDQPATAATTEKTPEQPIQQTTKHDDQPSDIPEVHKVTISGRLLDEKDKSPIARVQVMVMACSEKDVKNGTCSASITFGMSGELNPGSTSDNAGNFTIVADRRFWEKTGRFALWAGYLPGKTDNAGFLQGGNPSGLMSIKIDNNVKEIDLGDFICSVSCKRTK